MGGKVLHYWCSHNLHLSSLGVHLWVILIIRDSTPFLPLLWTMSPLKNLLDTCSVGGLITLLCSTHVNLFYNGYRKAIFYLAPNWSTRNKIHCPENSSYPWLSQWSHLFFFHCHSSYVVKNRSILGLSRKSFGTSCCAPTDTREQRSSFSSGLLESPLTCLEGKWKYPFLALWRTEYVALLQIDFQGNFLSQTSNLHSLICPWINAKPQLLKK